MVDKPATMSTSSTTTTSATLSSSTMPTTSTTKPTIPIHALSLGDSIGVGGCNYSTISARTGLIINPVKCYASQGVPL